MLPQPVVVLGGGGFIGSNLCRKLHADGNDVTAVDIQWPSFRDPILDGVKRWTLDLSVDASSALLGAGTVFHLAADMGGVGWFHSDKDWGSALINGRITGNVLEAAGRCGVQRLIYASSACAAAIEPQQTPGRPYAIRESDLEWGTPDARYGAEKRYGAWMCERAPFDARVAVVHTVYGPGQEHEGQRMKFPAAVATKALRARESGVLELWGDGHQLRSYLYIDDAVDRFIQLASADNNPGPINLGATGAISCNAIARICLDVVGAQRAEIVHVDGPTGVASRDCNPSKWVAMFGEPHQTSYRDGFALFIEWLEGVVA